MKKPILVFCGLLGTGKTYASTFAISQLSDYTRFNTDDVRKLMGFKTFDRKDTPKVNEYMYSHAEELLDEGKGVMFDSAYKLREAREKLYAMARKHNVPLIIVECVSSPKIAIARLTSRPGRDKEYGSTNKEADYHEYVKLFEPVRGDFNHPEMELVSYITLNTETYKIETQKLALKQKDATKKTIEKLSKLFKKLH